MQDIHSISLMNKVYLACPYTHKDPVVRAGRVSIASSIAGRLMTEGVTVFSPITHGHFVADYLHKDFVENHDFWMKQCLPMLFSCEAMVVIPFDGWRTSKGVYTEFRFCNYHNIPVYFYDEPTDARFDVPDPEELDALGYQIFDAKRFINA